MRKKIYRKLLIIIILIICIFILKNINFEEYTYTKKSAFPKEVYGVTVNNELINVGTKARNGKKRKIKFIVIHETDNFSNGADAKRHAIYLSENNKTSTSWHYTVDSTEIYHHIPDNEIAHHAGTQEGNKYGIGIELCVNKDGNFEKTFDNASKLVAYLLKEYNLTINNIKTHKDCSGKDCPNSILKDNRVEEFIKKVEYYKESE